MNFRVGILQKRSMAYNIDRNTDDVISFMVEASKNNADILLLPECYITGYVFAYINEDALEDTSTCLKKKCEAAKKYEIGVVATAFTKGKEKPRNSAFMIDKNGEILMKYSKVHTCDFSNESEIESGDEFMVCDFNGVNLGVMICYDREFPESARILMLRGAELILVPNDCGTMKPRVQALSTRAYENMVGVVMANPNGENAGMSCAYSPICWDKNGKSIDNEILLADEQSEKLMYADFDLDILRKYRKDEKLGNTFRKIEAYKDLVITDGKGK